MDIVAVVSDDIGGGRPFAGRRLLDHALAAARAARPITRTVCVTGDPRLAETAAAGGCDVVTAAAGEPAPDRAAALNLALAHIRDRAGLAPAVALHLDPAFPFVGAEVIEAAVVHLLQCGADSLVSVHLPGGPLWQVTAGEAERVAEEKDWRYYVENGALIAVRVGVFANAGSLPAGRTVLFPISGLAGLRLTADAEWPIAEAVFEGVSAHRAKSRLKGVRLVVFDFDGVMTDNRVLVFEDGREAVLCNRSDGLGLERLRAAGLPLAVISKERNPVVAARCRKLRIPCQQGIDDKLAVLTEIAEQERVKLADVAYVGNDINDLACLEAVGVAVAPADAYPEVLRLAHVVTRAKGGFGAVRELCDLIVAAQAAEAAG